MTARKAEEQPSPIVPASSPPRCTPPRAQRGRGLLRAGRASAAAHGTVPLPVISYYPEPSSPGSDLETSEHVCVALAPEDDLPAAQPPWHLRQRCRRRPRGRLLHRATCARPGMVLRALVAVSAEGPSTSGLPSHCRSPGCRCKWREKQGEHGQQRDAEARARGSHVASAL